MQEAELLIKHLRSDKAGMKNRWMGIVLRSHIIRYGARTVHQII